jgi:hypothetical protein
LRWGEALALVIGTRSREAVAGAAECSVQAVGAWLRQESVPTATRWRALVISAGMEDRWAELSAARDAVARKPTGRPRLSKAVKLERLNKQIQEVENG